MNINTRARNVSINNGVVYINGKRVDTKDEKQITIIVEGNCESVISIIRAWRGIND